MKALQETARRPTPNGVFMSSSNVVITAAEILPLYNALLNCQDPELDRLRVVIAAVLHTQIEDGMIRGQYVLADNRQERRHGA
jgi:hypothetical protein